MHQALRHLAFALAAVLLFSCSSAPTVHFYTDAVADTDIDIVSELLVSNGYRVALNDRVIPDIFSRSTIIHPLVVQDFSAVTELAEILRESGHPVAEISDLIVGKHIYTTSNIGLYLIEVPRRTKESAVVEDGGMPTRGDLSGLYDGLCGDDEGQLNLYGNGVAIFEFWKWSESDNGAQSVLLDGKWSSTESILRVELFNAGIVEFDIADFEREVVGYGHYSGIRLDRIEKAEPAISCDFIIEAGP